MTAFYGARDQDIDDRAEHRRRGLEHLDRLARQGAVEGGWITPPIQPAITRTQILIVLLLGFCAASALIGLAWAILVAMGPGDGT